MKKIIHYIFNSKHEKLILIGLPFIAIIVASSILIPQILGFIEYYDNSKIIITTSEIVNTAPVPSPTLALESPQVSSAIQTESVDKNIHLTSMSVEKDLYVFVKDENNENVSGFEFKINIKFPDGIIKEYSTDKSGCCYINNLSAEKYEISMQKYDGYSLPATIYENVKESITYTQISNVEEIIDIRDLTEGLNEIKNNNEKEASTETVIEYINTDYSDTVDVVTDNTFSQSLSVTSDGQSNVAYVYDSNGNYIYKYTYYTKDQYLLDRNNNVTDVIPYLENDVLMWGLRYNEEKSCYETVELFDSENLPLQDYMIDAEPVTSNDTVKNSWQNEDGGTVYYSYGNKVTGLKNIDGKLYYFDSNGFKANSVGIDVSFYNGNINWTAVKNAGVDFVIIRIGFRGWGSGAVYQDTCFLQNLRGAKEAGLKVGAYFYSTAINKVEAIEEASICLSWLAGETLDLPLFIDMEFSGDYPEGRQDTLSNATRVEIAQAFCETVKTAGYKPGVYATQSFLLDEIDYNSISQYFIWMASFTDNYVVPSFAYRYDMWQFTDFGKVSGVNGSVDFNVIR